MADLKFCGKRIDTGEWVIGYYLDGYIVNYIDLAESWEPGTSDHKLTVRAYQVNPSTVSIVIAPDELLKISNNKK